jgi:hypothetical protein
LVPTTGKIILVLLDAALAVSTKKPLTNTLLKKLSALVSIAEQKRPMLFVVDRLVKKLWYDV